MGPSGVAEALQHPSLSLPMQVMVLADSKEAATVVPQWHRTPSGVLITTHEMFAMLGALRGCCALLCQLRSACCAAAECAMAGVVDHGLQMAAPSCCRMRCGWVWNSRCRMTMLLALLPFAVTGSKRGPRAKGQRSLSASGAQLAQLEAAAQQAQQAQQAEGPSVAEMLRDGPSVVVVDEAHVVKTDTVRAEGTVCSTASAVALPHARPATVCRSARQCRCISM